MQVMYVIIGMLALILLFLMMGYVIVSHKGNVSAETQQLSASGVRVI